MGSVHRKGQRGGRLRGVVYEEEHWGRGEAVELVTGKGSSKVVFPRTRLFAKGRRLESDQEGTALKGMGASFLTWELCLLWAMAAACR